MSPLLSSNSASTFNSTHNSYATTTTTTTNTTTHTDVTTTTFHFMECIPLEIRMEIYSMIHHVHEPLVYFDYDRQNATSYYNFHVNIRNAFHLLKQQITIAVIVHDTMEALPMLLSPITEPFFRYEVARILAKYKQISDRIQREDQKDEEE